MRYEQPSEPVDVADDLARVYAEVFREPPYHEGPEQVREFTANYLRDAGRPGVGVVIARDDHDRIIGFAYGASKPAGWWWDDCDSPSPDELEGAEMFALYEWAVLPDHRRHGIGGQLLTRLLASRPEPWVTLNVNPKADAYRIYHRTGWRQVGVCHHPGWPEMAVMTRANTAPT